MLEIEQWKLLSNSNGHNFSLRGPIQAHYISRRSKLNNENSREIQLVITFHKETRFVPIIYRDAQNRTTEALVKMKWQQLLTRMLNGLLFATIFKTSPQRFLVANSFSSLIYFIRC